MTSDDERREVARRLRELDYIDLQESLICAYLDALGIEGYTDWVGIAHCLADLIEPSYKPDAKYEAWYNSLSHYGDKRGVPSTIRELIEEIVWTALTVDLGPNGNTDPSTGIDEGGVYTNKLFAEWEREALRLSGGIDRDALLALADEMERKALNWDATQGDVPLVHAGYLMGYADRIREALGDCQRGVSGVGRRGASRGPSGQVAGVARAAPREGAGEKE